MVANIKKSCIYQYNEGSITTLLQANRKYEDNNTYSEPYQDLKILETTRISDYLTKTTGNTGKYQEISGIL